MRVVVAGAGIYGLASALALAERGHDVIVCDPGPLPHPLAATTDLSKLVRADYGRDPLYTGLMASAFPRWDAWNERFGRPLWHRSGLRVLRSGPLVAGTFEGDSLAELTSRGFPIREEPPPPPWVGFAHGYRNDLAGWAESGAVAAALVTLAEQAGVRFRAEAVRSVDDGPRTDSGRLDADVTVVAAGTWSLKLLPELASRMVARGQPVLHFRPADPVPFRAPGFLPWCADIADTGWYGFPATADGVVKIANHGPGLLIDPDAPRVVDPAWDDRFRAFLQRHLPALADAPIVYRRLCLYADSADGDFFVDRVPDRPGVVVATGGSGHGFKFGPVLGELVADVVEGGAPVERFRWRDIDAPRAEAARHRG